MERLGSRRSFVRICRGIYAAILFQCFMQMHVCDFWMVVTSVWVVISARSVIYAALREITGLALIPTASITDLGFFLGNFLRKDKHSN